MRIPRTPPNINEIIENRQSDFFHSVADPKYVAFASKCNDKYWHWDKIRIIARGERLDPELVWAAVKLGRRVQYQSLPLLGASGQSLRFTLPSRLQRELMHIDQQLAGHISLSEDAPIESPMRNRYIQNAIGEEAIASSMLEGAATTRQDAKRMIRSNRQPRTDGERMVMNNYHAIQFMREHLNTPLTHELLLELQSILTTNTIEKYKVGRFRNTGDTIRVEDQYGEIMHTPPEAACLPGRISSICEFANMSQDSEPFIHPVIRASILHFQLSFDHPFCDGNGRTARAIFYWYLLRCDYWLFEFLPISRLIYKSPPKYGRAFLYSETDEFDITYFLLYKMRIISLARKELQQYLSRKQKEIKHAKSIVATDIHLNHRQRGVVMWFVKYPEGTMTIAEHQNRHVIAYGTARSDLLKLVDAGFLKLYPIGNRFDFNRSPMFENLVKHKDV